MRFSLLAVVLLPALSASAETIRVIVGQGGALSFTPTTATVQAGDVLAFQFQSKNHTVTQSSFARPCEINTENPGSPPVDSGFFPVPQGANSFPEWSITLNSITGPLWFYCRQAQHCSASGMVFAVNPTPDQTFEAFRANAMGQTQGGGAGGAAGGGGITVNNSTTGTPSVTGAQATASSGAMRTGGSATALLTFAGLVLGLTL